MLKIVLKKMAATKKKRIYIYKSEISDMTISIVDLINHTRCEPEWTHKAGLKSLSTIIV